MLVEITEDNFDVIIDIRYATDDNFTAKPVYSRAACFLHPEASEALKRAIDLAAKDDLRFKIFDAYRPLEAQQALWNHTPDPDFLSNPDGGACPHCRGVAIDLTLIDEDDNELDMGTGFDEFTPLSHHGNQDIPHKAQSNREYLKKLMLDAGWDFYTNEWWHYQLFNCREYELLSDKQANTNMM